jgi:hypothetical protein
VLTAPVTVTGVFLVAGLALTGCGRQVAVEPPQQAPAICSDLVAGLPETVDGAGRRPTTPASPATAAWGEPPIVVRCGVARPAALTSTSVLLEVEGIGWLPEPLAAGTLFTAVEFPDSEPGQASVLPFLEVAIPQEYQSPGGIIADISAAITTDRSVED